MFATNSIRGSTLAYTKTSCSRRAFIAADLRQGHLQLVRPTLRQVSLLVGVSMSYVRLAEQASDDDRRRVFDYDHVSLSSVVQTEKLTLALPAPRVASDDELVALVKANTPERVFAAIERVVV
jgi:hypothetical protein